MFLADELAHLVEHLAVASHGHKTDRTVLISLQDTRWKAVGACLVLHPDRGLSSAGRAPDLHSGGQEFDPPRLHHQALAWCQQDQPEHASPISAAALRGIGVGSSGG